MLEKLSPVPYRVLAMVRHKNLLVGIYFFTIQVSCHAEALGDVRENLVKFSCRFLTMFRHPSPLTRIKFSKVWALFKGTVKIKFSLVQVTCHVQALQPAY